MKYEAMFIRNKIVQQEDASFNSREHKGLKSGTEK